MPQEFQIRIPKKGGLSSDYKLKIGGILYVLGANGTGKSSLVSHLFSQNHANAKRISAHRQTWFESNTLDITPRNREDMEKNFRSQDATAQARYRDWNPAARSNIAIFDLVDADTMQARKIAEFVRANDDAAAKKEAQNPSPIQVINDLMRLSNIHIDISLEEGQKIVARKSGGTGYSVAELSDGERNAFLIAADILTAKTGSLIIIDEPERHLHRSIVSPLLRNLFEKRKDCAFIVSTHELMLPIDTPDASILLVRGCDYEGQSVRAWTMDILPAGSAIDEDLRRDILGARRKILFVEGTEKSLDTPLYSLLFPQVSIIAKQGCRDVEHAVRGLRRAPEMHWISAWGIVDNDQRPPENIARLRDAGIWALSHYSVESLYYHRDIVKLIAMRQSKLTGADAEANVASALEGAIEAVKIQKKHLIETAVYRAVRNTILNGIPSREEISGADLVKVEVDSFALLREETDRFSFLAEGADWNGLLTRYPLRESSAFDRIVSGIKVADQSTYRAAVLKLLQDDPIGLMTMRNFLGDLYANIIAEPVYESKPNEIS